MRAGWQPTRAWDFDLYFRRQVPSASFFRQLPPGARINHIPGIATLGPLASAGDEERAVLACHVLVARIDPLALHLWITPAIAELPGAARRAVELAIVSRVASGYDALVRGARDLLPDRGACFELLRFDVGLRGSDATVERCALSPPVDDALAAATLAVLGLAPDEGGATAAYALLVPQPHGQTFLDACPWPRWSDLASSHAVEAPMGVACTAVDRVFDGGVVLFSEATSRFHLLNDTAGYVWARVREGASPATIAAAITAQFGVEEAVARGDVWDALARWAADGWIERRVDAASRIAPGRAGAAIDASRLEAPLPASPREEIAPRCRLARASVVLAGRPTGAADAGAVVLVGHEASGLGAVAAVVAARGDASIVSGEGWIDEDTGCAPATPAHLAVFESDDEAVAHLSQTFAASPHASAPNERGVRFFEAEGFEGPTPPVATIVLVRRASSAGATTIEPLAPRALLLALTALGMEAEPRWSAERALSLLAWLEETPAFELVVGDVVSAADALAREVLA